MSPGNLVRVLLIAGAIAMTAAGVIIFVVRPTAVVGLVGSTIGAALIALVTPSNHWQRAFVGASTLGGILALTTLLRVLAGMFIEREMQPDSALLWRLGLSLLLFGPFVWWQTTRRPSQNREAREHL